MQSLSEARAETLMERRISVGKFIPIVEIPSTPLPNNMEDPNVKKDYCRKEAEVHNKRALVYKASCRTRKQMEAAKILLSQVIIIS